MAERLQPKNFQIDPYRMAILESGWLNAMERGDSTEAMKYISEGLSHRFHLNHTSADEAAGYILAYFGSRDLKEEESNLFQHHKILSEASGIGFDPHLATEVALEIEKNDQPTIGQVSRYQSIIYGGLSEGNLFLSTELRIIAIGRYHVAKEKGTKKEAMKAFGDLVSGLAESYEALNEVLKNSSANLAEPLKQ